MSETYVECLIKAKGSAFFKFLQFVLIVLAVLSGVSMLFTAYIGLILAAVFGFAAYYAALQGNVEYEYLYLDKELTVDRISNQSKRKRVGTYSINDMEIVAPFRSYHLDNYKNRQVQVKDYSIGEELKPDLRYVIYLEGKEKIIFSPSEEMVKAMKNNAPRKVFMD